MIQDAAEPSSHLRSLILIEESPPFAVNAFPAVHAVHDEGVLVAPGRIRLSEDWDRKLRQDALTMHTAPYPQFEGFR